MKGGDVKPTRRTVAAWSDGMGQRTSWSLARCCHAGLLALLLALALASSGCRANQLTVVFPPLTALSVKSLFVFCSTNVSHSATATDPATSLNFAVSLSTYGTYRKLMSSSNREMSFVVTPLAQAFHVYGKWGIAPSNTDAFAAFPDAMLGTTYVVSAWSACCSASAFILISALDTSSTTVTVSLPPSAPSLTVNGVTHTSDFTLTLTLREVVTITSSDDVSGTTVTGSSAIYVQSGSQTAGVQGTTTGQLVETMPPVSNLGTKHYGVPTSGRTTGDVYRLVSSSASNSVTIIEDSVGTSTVTLTSSSRVHDYAASNPVVITSSQPLLVTMFSKSDDSSTIPPSMTFIPSTDHWASQYVIKEADGSLTRPEYVIVAIGASYTSGVRKTLLVSNGAVSYVTGWTAFVSDSSYSYVTLSITQSFLLDHDSSQPFMVIQHGATTSWAYSFVPAFEQSVYPATTTTSTTTTTAASNSNSSSSNSSNSSGGVVASESWLEGTEGQVLVGASASALGAGLIALVAWKAVSIYKARTNVNNSAASLLDGSSPPSSAPLSSQHPHIEMKKGLKKELTRIDI